MKRGMTNEPCHGCGKEELHAKNVLCFDCRRLLSEARNKTRVNGWYERTEEFGLPAEREGWPCRWAGKYYISEKFRTLLAKVLLSLAVPTTESDKAGNLYGGQVFHGDVYHYLPQHNSGWFQGRRIPSESAQVIRDFDAVLGEEFELAFNAGVEHGRNLLVQVAKGEISLKEFDAVNRTA